MTELDIGGGVTAWRQIADRLREEIGRDFGPGERLPTESALAERFGVNRHTVRRALAALTELGLVRASRGSGTYVEQPRLAYPIGPRTRFSENVAADGRLPSGEVLDAAEMAAPLDAAIALAIEPGALALMIDLRRRADGSPIVVSRTWLPLPRFAGLDEVLKTGASISEAFARYGAGDYRRSSTRVSARPADPWETDALELAHGRIVMVVESVNVDGAATPIQATRASFAADRVELLIQS